MASAEERKARVIAACEEALDNRVFYEDEFKAFVRERTDQYDEAVENFLGTFRQPDGTFQEKREWLLALAKQVYESPRGTWAIWVPFHEDGKDWFKPIISNGSVDLKNGGSFDSFETPPTYATVFARMVGYEIYTTRKAVESRRELERNRDAIETFGIAVGNTYKDLKLSKKYSSGEVTAVDADSGQVSLVLKIRGSRNRWTTTVGAATLAQAANLEPAGPTIRLL